MQAPLVSPLDCTKDFILYISTSTYVVASVLIEEGEDHHEHVIYYINKTLYSPSTTIEMMKS